MPALMGHFVDEWIPVGNRSGYFNSVASVPIVASTEAAPASTSASSQASAPSAPSPSSQPVTIADSYAYEGPRFDLGAGRGVRVRIGRQDDGKYGIRIWSSSGVLSHDQTYA